MILHVSLQTDIAQFYSIWLLNRLDAGYVDFPGEKTIKRLDFNKNKISKIYFWSKDPHQLLQYSEKLRKLKYDYELIFELTSYDKFYEPKLKSKNRIINDFKKASKLLGKDKVSFCYAPVFLSAVNTEDIHYSQFKYLCNVLHSYTHNVYIGYEATSSCVYGKNFNINLVPKDLQSKMNDNFAHIASTYNLNFKIKPKLSDLPENEIDLGEKDCCPAICAYCPSLTNKRTVKIKNQNHNPTSSLLIGNLAYDDKVEEILIDPVEKVKEVNPITEVSFF